MTLLVGVFAGSVGAVVRHVIVTWIEERRSAAAAIGAVNLVGAFAIGMVVGSQGFGLLVEAASIGFLGGLTTFSTLMSETLGLVSGVSGRLRPIGLLYPLVQTVAGVGLVAVGVMVGAGSR